METPDAANDNHDPDAVRDARAVRDLAKEDARLAHADGRTDASRRLSLIAALLSAAIASGAFHIYNR